MSEKIPGDRFFEFARGNSHPPLTDEQKRRLDFAKRWWPNAGARENDIRENFAESSTSFFQKLHALRSHPEAASYAPSVMKRMDSVIDRSRGTGRASRGY